MRIIRLLAILLACMSVVAPCSASENEELLKVVVLSRHGVRSPTQDARLLSLWSQKPWPQWPVAKGELTPRGARLVTAMWSNLRQTLQKTGVLEKNIAPESVYVRADVDERTKATARALLDGLYPGGKLDYVVAQEKLDPLFHPVKAGLYRYDAIAVATDVLGMTHGGLERLQDEFAGAMSLMSRISGPPSATLCSRFALMPTCQLTDLPNAISISSDGAGIRLVGSLGIASSMAEIFLLEYGEWPEEAAGWGLVDARVLSQVLPIHSRVFDVVNRAPVVAWANGSSLLKEMASALLATHSNRRINDAKLVVFVGHDTNIANVGGLLGIDWQPSGYAPNGIPPAGALFLELWQKSGARYVKARFYAQTPKSLHEPLNASGVDEETLARFAPVASLVHAGNASMDMEASDFMRLVENVTEGAPLAPGVGKE